MATPATKRYKANTPIVHDGERYATGDGVPLTASQAKRLKAIGAIGNVVNTKPAGKPAE